MMLQNLKGLLGFNHVKPSFIIIGAQKAGTTALYNYLEQHEDLIGSDPKEVHFFDSEENLNYKKYRRHFPKKGVRSKQYFEASPRYLYFPGTAERLQKYNPEFKLIVSLRDPVSRAYSAWNMYQQMKVNSATMKRFEARRLKQPDNKLYDFLSDPDVETFRDWVNKEIFDVQLEYFAEPSILRRGHYQEQILEYLKFFPKAQMLFVNSNSLRSDTKNELTRVCEFLQVKNFDFDHVTVKEHHSRTYEEPILIEDREFLEQYYSDKNSDLEQITGVHFDWL